MNRRTALGVMGAAAASPLLINNEPKNIEPNLTTESIKDLPLIDSYIPEHYSTGFKKIDQATKGGFRQGTLNVVKGAHGTGKSSALRAFAFNMPNNKSIGYLAHDYDKKIIDRKKWRHFIGLRNLKSYNPNATVLKFNTLESMMKSHDVIIIDDINDFLPEGYIGGDLKSRKSLLSYIKSFSRMAYLTKTTIIYSVHCLSVAKNKIISPLPLGHSYNASILFDLSHFGNNTFLSLDKNRHAGKVQIPVRFNNGIMYS